MFNAVLDNLKLSRAKHTRELEYLHESMNAIERNKSISRGEELYINESIDDLIEAKKTLDTFSANDSVAEEREIKNILEADHDISFNDMIDLNMLMEKVC